MPEWGTYPAGWHPDPLVGWTLWDVRRGAVLSSSSVLKWWRRSRCSFAWSRAGRALPA